MTSKYRHLSTSVLAAFLVMTIPSRAFGSGDYRCQLQGRVDDTLPVGTEIRVRIRVMQSTPLASDSRSAKKACAKLLDQELDAFIKVPDEYRDAIAPSDVITINRFAVPFTGSDGKTIVYHSDFVALDKAVQK
jgi:hypothetical protein